MKNNLDSLFRTLHSGNISVTPGVVAGGKLRQPTRTCLTLSEDRLRAQLDVEYGTDFQETIHFQFSEGEVLCQRRFRNTSGKVRRVNELSFLMKGIDFGGDARDDFFYHVENPRIYGVMIRPVDRTAENGTPLESEFDSQAGNRWADPGVVCERIGRSPYQPFPAILLSNRSSTQGLVHGTLSQQVFYHNYLLKHQNGAIQMEILSSFKGLGALEMTPERVLVDEWYLGETSYADDIGAIFSGYAMRLREALPVLYGTSSINRDCLIWGSWNDGIFRDISEEKLLREAAFLKRHFPTVRWIQVDDGYAVMNKAAHGLGVPFEGADGVDKKKFPHGLRHYTDALRQIGLRPAVWIGGLCPKETKIYKEHPEWFLDYSYRVKTTAPLDVSRSDVRKYMVHALDTFCQEWGFEGIKHDFWSYAFEDSSNLLSKKRHSGYEWRRWWLNEVRSHLKADGYFQTGCDIVMGNPFLGEHFTNYRYGIDIAAGDWENVKTSFLWGVACFATRTGDMFVPNSDSIGLFPNLNDTEAMFCINYCLATHSMVEISGLLSQHQDSPRFQMLKKAACNPNNGQEIRFAKYDYRNPKQKTPEIIYFKTAHFCPAEDQPGLPIRTVALFNLEDQEKPISFNAACLDIPNGKYRLIDVWSGEIMRFEGTVSFTVPPHGSRLLAVCESDAVQLLDANIRILHSEREGNALYLFFDYANEAEFTFASKPTRVTVNGTPVKVTGTTLKTTIGKSSMMIAEFA